MELEERKCASDKCNIVWRCFPNSTQICCSRSCECDLKGMSKLEKVRALNHDNSRVPRRLKAIRDAEAELDKYLEENRI